MVRPVLLDAASTLSPPHAAILNRPSNYHFKTNPFFLQLYLAFQPQLRNVRGLESLSRVDIHFSRLSAGLKT